MRRFAVLACLTACSFVPGEDAAPGAAQTPAGSARLDPWANPTPPPPSPLTPAATNLPSIQLPNPPASEPPPTRTYGPTPQPAGLHTIVAPPAQTTRALAVLPDGTAAVSADVAGSVRLWPALDGTREPVVLPMRRPVALAMRRNGTNLLIAGIDGAGQVELVTTSALGESTIRESFPLPRPAIAVYATTKGFLIERDDQHLVFELDGWPASAEVEPPPGSHIAAIAVNGDAMLVLLAGADGVHGRWLALDNGLHWGDKTPALKITPGPIALAPNHTVIAAIGTGNRLLTVSLATGKRIEQSPESDIIDPTMAPIGFVDASTVLVHFTGFTSLWHIDAGSFAELAEDRRETVVAIGGSRAIFGEGADLKLADSAGTLHYLGFRISNLNAFSPSARALLATDGQQLVRIGADLRDHASYDLPTPHGPGYNVLSLLDANHVLVQSYQSRTYLDVIALDSLDVTSVPGVDRFLGYDLATHTAAFSDDSKVSFRHFDGATGAFGKAAEVAAENASQVTFDGTSAVVGWLRSDDHFIQQTVTHIRPDAGTLTVGRATEQLIEREGDEGSFPIIPAAPVFTRSAKSPDGALVATIAAGRMSLRDATGTTRWTVPAAGATDVVWLRSGELIATGGGLARVDLETGAFADRRCGWQFGLWNDPVRQFASTMMCEAE